MERTELQSALKQQQIQSSGKNTFVFLFVYILGMLVIASLLAFMKGCPLYASISIWLPVFFGYLLGFPFLWMKLKGIEPVKLRCHSCESELKTFQIHIVMASKHCPICGEGILDEEKDQ